MTDSYNAAIGTHCVRTDVFGRCIYTHNNFSQSRGLYHGTTTTSRRRLDRYPLKPVPARVDSPRKIAFNAIEFGPLKEKVTGSLTAEMKESQHLLVAADIYQGNQNIGTRDLSDRGRLYAAQAYLDRQLPGRFNVTDNGFSKNNYLVAERLPQPDMPQPGRSPPQTSDADETKEDSARQNLTEAENKLKAHNDIPFKYETRNLPAIRTGAYPDTQQEYSKRLGRSPEWLTERDRLQARVNEARARVDEPSASEPPEEEPPRNFIIARGGGTYNLDDSLIGLQANADLVSDAARSNPLLHSIVPQLWSRVKNTAVGRWFAKKTRSYTNQRFDENVQNGKNVVTRINNEGHPIEKMIGTGVGANFITKVANGTDHPVQAYNAIGNGSHRQAARNNGDRQTNVRTHGAEDARGLSPFPSELPGNTITVNNGTLGVRNTVMGRANPTLSLQNRSLLRSSIKAGRLLHDVEEIHADPETSYDANTHNMTEQHFNAVKNMSVGQRNDYLNSLRSKVETGREVVPRPTEEATGAGGRSSVLPSFSSTVGGAGVGFLVGTGLDLAENAAFGKDFGQSKFGHYARPLVNSALVGAGLEGGGSMLSGKTFLQGLTGAGLASSLGGAAVGVGATDFLKDTLHASDQVADVSGGAIGGAASHLMNMGVQKLLAAPLEAGAEEGGAAVGDLAGGIAADAAADAALGAWAGPLGVALGAGVGALFGGLGYLLSKSEKEKQARDNAAKILKIKQFNDAVKKKNILIDSVNKHFRNMSASNYQNLDQNTLNTMTGGVGDTGAFLG